MVFSLFMAYVTLAARRGQRGFIIGPDIAAADLGAVLGMIAMQFSRRLFEGFYNATVFLMVIR